MASVTVVGAGLGGLSAAIRLAAAGDHVTLLERSDRPGGRAGRLERSGFTFDTGPTVLTMPALLEDLFALAGETMADHLQMQRLDPAYRAAFSDGSVLHIRGTVESMAEEVGAVCGAAEADRFRRFAEHLGRLYAAQIDTFIDANFDSPLDLLRPRALARITALGGFRRMMPLVSSFLTDWRLIRMFTFQAMYAGMSPYEALGVYSVIAYMDAIAGVFYPQGGIHEVSTALAAMAARCGVDVRMGTAVESVDVRGGAAAGVTTVDGEHIASDVVVLNPDLPIAYRDLLGPEYTPRRVARLQYSPSCVVVHLGLDRKLGGAAHHNIHFAEQYRDSFDDILSGRLQRDPSWFVTVPTVSDATAAPPGGETAFVLTPAPNLVGNQLNWDAQAPREIAMAQHRLTAAGYGDVAAATVVAEAVTPQDWRRQGMAAGTPFAASHTFAQTGPFRPRNVAPKVGGVVFTGSGTTPGVGVPMVLISGKLAAQRVRQMLTDRAA